MTITLVEKKDSPIVSTNLIYKVGSKNELKTQTGFAHLFEHLMFEGTERFPKGEFDKMCSQAGGTNNAYTIYDWTAYTMTLPAEKIDLGFLLDSDRMFNMSPTPKAFENQKNVVCEEIKQTVFNQPYGRWRELLADTAFPTESGYNWEVHGGIDHVSNSTLEDANKFFRAFYTPSNAFLTVVGDYNFDYIKEMAEKYYGQEKSASEYPKNNFENISTGVSTYEDNIPYDAVFISFHTPAFTEKESLVSDILAYIAGTGKSSILYNSLVQQKEIVSETGAFSDKREKNSLMTFYAIANTPDMTAEDLTEILQAEIEKLFDEETIALHLEKTKNQIRTQQANQLLISKNLADAVNFNTTFFNDPYRIYNISEEYFSITAKDSTDFAKKYFTADNSIIVRVEKQKNGTETE
jgi:predicted Zn-dependent peptidase